MFVFPRARCTGLRPSERFCIRTATPKHGRYALLVSLYRDRRHAGRELAVPLRQFAGRSDVVVLALPRGGVPVGYEIARALGAPLDVFVVRKLGLPFHRELAIGAIASGGIRVLNQELIEGLRISPSAIDAAAEAEQWELERREALYRGGRTPATLFGRTVILVDDGLATGASMRAAIEGVRDHRPARIVVAAPVASADTCRELQALADDVVCAATPEPFQAVGLWYDDFSQTPDLEVRELLALAADERRAPSHEGAGP